MNSILITGATSMIGVALIEEALANETEVFAIVRNGTRRLSRLPSSPLLHVVFIDSLNEYQSILKNITKPIDVFYHFAWLYTEKQYRNEPVLQNENIAISLKMVEFCKALNCKKFVFAGSQAEYGPRTDKIYATDRVAPVLSYGIAKYAAEKLTANLCSQYGIVHACGRIFSVYGKNDNEGTMLNYAISKFKNKENAYFASGQQKWDYLNEKDAGNAFFLIGDKVNSNFICNVASGISLPIYIYIYMVANLFNSKKYCVFNQVETQPLGLEADIAELESLGFKPSIKFEDGIKTMVEIKG